VSSEESDHALAARVATAAGELLLEVRETLIRQGTSYWELEDEGDKQAHILIRDLIAEARPDDGQLSEEGRDDGTRLAKERVWIIDPLDGTNEFGSPPRPDWAVHVALAVNGVPAAGAVALPAMGQTLATEPAPELPPIRKGTPRVIASR